MKRLTFLFLIAAVAATLMLTTACAKNPAEGKDEAKVSEPVAATTEEGGADAAAADGTAYTFTDASKITWVGSKVTGSHDGGFETFDGSVTVAGDDAATAAINVTIDTTSLWSDNDNLTGHLKSADFFDVETYPTSTFESTGVAANDEGGYTVTGNLNLHGVTKQIEFPATIAVADGQVTANAEFFIKRFDFGIEYAGKADDLIRDEVVIKLDIVAAADAGADEEEGGEEAADEGEEEAAA
jgi:polyisoprenoid-binding protein YceI